MALLTNGNVGLGNPGTDVNLANCTAVQCGVGDNSIGFDCSVAGYVGNHTCDDPVCEPFKAEMKSHGMCTAPFSTSVAPIINNGAVQFPARKYSLPDTPATPNTVTSGPAVAPMNVPNIVSTPGMPTIVNSQCAAPEHTDACDGPMAGFARWVDENPVMAAGLLIAAAYMVKSKGGR